MNRKQRRRAGFTLIELLVVIAIIGILVGMVAVAVSGSVGSQQRRNTDVLLRKLDSSLLKQWAEAMKAARTKAPPPAVLALAKTTGSEPDTDPQVVNRAKVIWAKMQMVREFPMTYNEALAPHAAFQSLGVTASDLPPVQEYVRQVSARRSNNASAQSQCAACLLLAIQQNRGGQRFEADTALGAGHVADTDQDGVNEVVDGWQKPVYYFRWVSGNPDVDALNRTARGALDRDTEDPDGALMNAQWNASPNGVRYNSLLHPIQAGNPPQARAFYSEPVIVSGGKDGLLGLSGFLGGMTSQQAQDNRYSFQLR